MKSYKILILVIMVILGLAVNGCMFGGSKSRPAPTRSNTIQKKRPSQGYPRLSPSQYVKPSKGKNPPSVGQFTQ